MRKWFFVIIVVMGLFAGWQVGFAQEQAVFVLEIDGPVMPAMSDYFTRGIAEAEEAGATAVLIILDTPGGDITTTLNIVQIFRNAKIPIIVYIGPRGSQAASAGSVITIAAHASGMAPETTIGAASPVGDGGAELGETISRKIKEDLKATVRSLTLHRSEAASNLAEEMIEDASAVTSEEAFEVGLIDAIATDADDLLNQLDGLSVEVDGQQVVLATKSAVQRPNPMNSIEQILFALVNPILVGILLTIGVQAILIELSSPGGYVVGIIGAICLALALYGLGQLPVNFLGLGLIVLAFVLFVLEVKATTHGVLAFSGTVALIGGLLMLFNSPGTPEFAQISIPAAIGIGAATAVFFIFIVTMALRAQSRQPSTGSEGLIGQTGMVRRVPENDSDATPYKITALVAGELWQAEVDTIVKKGDKVVVTAVDRFTLHVRKVE